MSKTIKYKGNLNTKLPFPQNDKNVLTTFLHSADDLGTVIKNRGGKESLALLKKWPKMHFEEKILEKKHVYILVTKIYY